MRGHVAKKGKRWYPVVDVRDPETGARKRRWHPGHDTKREAATELTAILGSIDGGTYVEPSRRTVGKFLIDEWLPAVESSLRASTYSSYKWQLETHIVPRLGGVPLQHLTAPRLNAMYHEMLHTGRRNGRGGLSPRTVRYVHTIIRKALSDAVKWNLLTRNPADAADPPSAKATRPTLAATWNAEEVRTFLERVCDDRLLGAYVLLATTGMRRGEVLGLRWRNLNLDSGKLSVSETLINVYGKIESSTPKTNSGRRLVSLDRGTVAALREHRERQELERSFIGAAYQDDDLVFAREDGTPVHPYAFSRAFCHHAEDAGLPRLSVHGLRHTYATLALGAGVHPKVVSERLGHSSISITLDVYSHALPTMQETAAELVAAQILG